MLSADVNCNCFKLVNVLTASGVSSILPLSSEVSGVANATTGYLTPVNTSGVVGTITPPAGAVNDRFGIVDSRANAATNNITIIFGSGAYNLYGSIQNYVMDQDGAYATFRYLNSSIGWVVEK